MTKEEIALNKLIDAFVNPEHRDGVWGNLRYSESWDWIMPVVDKINSMGKEYNLTIFKTYVSLSVEKGGKVFKDFSFAYSENITKEQSGLEATYKLIIRFIKWHNEQVLTQTSKTTS